MADEQDVIFDEEEGEKETIKKLRERLKSAEGKAKEYLDSWQRAQADFVNLRKRDEEAKGEFVKFATADVVRDLIPILDSFHHAISHGEKGVEPIYKQMLKTLKEHGLEETNPIGKVFDPKDHESVGAIKTEEESDDHKILEVLQKGYIMGGKIIRPAKVKIGEFNK